MRQLIWLCCNLRIRDNRALATFKALSRHG